MTDDNDAAGAHPAALILPGIIVEPSWLHGRLGHARVRVVDLREDEAYTECHLPDAVQLDLARLGTARDGCDNVLLGPAEFADLMGGLGIGDGDVVIAYDDQWGLAAARLVWALHFYGHQAAGVLDGGWDRWRDESRSVTAVPSTPLGTVFKATPNPAVSAELGWLSQRFPGGEPKVIDTRTTAEFEQGHLPNALSWDWFNAVPAGSWNCTRDPEELSEEWGSLGIDPSHEIVVYCRSGMRAAHTYVALRHVGYSRVRLYDGSWQEWSMRT